MAQPLLRCGGQHCGFTCVCSHSAGWEQQGILQVTLGCSDSALVQEQAQGYLSCFANPWVYSDLKRLKVGNIHQQSPECMGEPRILPRALSVKIISNLSVHRSCLSRGAVRSACSSACCLVLFSPASNGSSTYCAFHSAQKHTRALNFSPWCNMVSATMRTVSKS